MNEDRKSEDDRPAPASPPGPASESEEQFRRAIEEAPIPIIMHAEDGQVLQISRTWTELTGYTQEDIKTFDAWLNTAYGEGVEAVRQHMRELLEGHRRSLNVEFPIRTRNGELRVWSFNASAPGRLSDGRRFIVGMALDITERIPAEQALRESEERWRLVAESVEDYAIITTDLNGIVTDWNVGAEKMFGYSRDEIIGSSADIIFTPEDRANGVPEEEMRTAAAEGRAEDERIHLRKNGEKFYVSGVMTPLRDGRNEGYVKIARDMTESIRTERVVREKRMLEVLVSAQEGERKRLARDLHDELGQELTALRLKLENLRQLSGEKAEMAARINDIQLLAKRIDEGIDFLSWEMRPAALHDRGLFNALKKYLSEWARYAGIKAEMLPSKIADKRFGDEVETNLYRIAQEAMNNIHKHASATAADVQLESHDGHIVLVISDNGVGFDPEAKLASIKSIGLIGMRERAQLIGGTIEIESAPAGGTTIFVRVPVTAEREIELGN